MVFYTNNPVGQWHPKKESSAIWPDNRLQIKQDKINNISSYLNPRTSSNCMLPIRKKNEKTTVLVADTQDTDSTARGWSENRAARNIALIMVEYFKSNGIDQDQVEQVKNKTKNVKWCCWFHSKKIRNNSKT